ncbi:unnamed protein product [Phaedon cochleariae]|uniref:Uncharacterized protein n=1 Tax=Phaedon cochleariae TaxID=80249 RepID=A0A9N9X395_PHACE|nr:unnamed protein product [Phaedon cochleariae]
MMINLLNELIHIIQIINYFFQIIPIIKSAPVEEPITFLQQYFNQDANPDKEFYKGHSSNFTTTYRKRKTEEGYISLCWAETLIRTENKNNKNITLSKRYSIIMESPINIDQQMIETDNTSCYEIVQNGTNGKRLYNFTTVKETDEYIVKEHKTLFCGAGPVLSEHFIVWPKLNRKQIEISIDPLPSSELENCTETSEPVAYNPKINISSTAVTFRSVKKKTQQPENSSETTTTDRTVKTSSAIPEEVGDPPIVGMTRRENENASISSEEEAHSRNLKNLLLKRDVNCTYEHQSEFCKELLEHSQILNDFQGNSSPALVNLFFPNQTFLEFFREFDGDRVFDVTATFILEVKERSSNAAEANNKMVSRIEVIENSVVASSINSTSDEIS